MRHISLLIIFTLSLAVIRGQFLSKHAKEFITEFYQQYNQLQRPFIYTKGIDSYQKTNILQLLQGRDTLKNWRIVDHKVYVIDSLILTSLEKKIIISGIENQTDTSLWNEKYIPNSSIIVMDTLEAIFKDLIGGWNYFHSNYGSSYHSFTIPVFLRNNQLCAFYYEIHCGMFCGEGRFAIYRREKNNWVRWITIYEWVS